MNPISHRRPAAVTRVLDTFKCLLLSPAVSCGMVEMSGPFGLMLASLVCGLLEEQEQFQRSHQKKDKN